MNVKFYFTPLGDSLTDRLRFRFQTDKGKVMNLFVQYETLVKGKWEAIVRYDCAHGFFHRDRLFPDGSQKKRKIDIPNSNLALAYAKQDFDDR